MDDFFIVFYVIWITLISTVLFLLIDQFHSSKFKLILPLVCGISLFFFTTVFDIYYGPLFLLKLLLVPLVLPFFVVAPVPFIEKKESAIFEKFFIFSGALAVLILYSILSQTVFHLGEKPLYGESILWDMGLLVMSYIMFYGMSRVQLFNNRVSKEKQEKTETRANNSSPPLDMKKITIFATFLLVLISPYFLLFLIGSLH